MGRHDGRSITSFSIKTAYRPRSKSSGARTRASDMRPSDRCGRSEIVQRRNSAHYDKNTILLRPSLRALTLGSIVRSRNGSTIA